MGIQLECFKNLFKKPCTTKYPFEKLKPYKRFRGKIKYLSKKCIGCMQCSRNCPSEAITFYKRGRIDFDMGICMHCGLCVDVCPVDAIEFNQQCEYADKNPKKFIVK